MEAEKLITDVITRTVSEVGKKYGMRLLRDGINLDFVVALRSFKTVGGDVVPADAKRIGKNLMREELVLREDPTVGVPRVTLRFSGAVYRVTMGSIKAFLTSFMHAFRNMWIVLNGKNAPMLRIVSPEGEERVMSEMKFFELLAERHDGWARFVELLKKLGQASEGNGTFTVDDIIEFYKYLYEVDSTHRLTKIMVRGKDGRIYAYPVIGELLERMREVLPGIRLGSRGGRDFFGVIADKASVLEIVIGKKELTINDVVNNNVALVLAGVNIEVGLGRKVKYRAGRVVAGVRGLKGFSSGSVSLASAIPLFIVPSGGWSGVLSGTVVEEFPAFASELIDALKSSLLENKDALIEYYNYKMSGKSRK